MAIVLYSDSWAWLCRFPQTDMSCRLLPTPPPGRPSRRGEFET